MRALHFRKCVKLLDFEHSGHRSHRKALAKALGVKLRSIDRYHGDIRQARALLPLPRVEERRRRRRRGERASLPTTDLPPRTKPRRAAQPSETSHDSPLTTHFAQRDLLRLARIDQLLKLEYSGYQGTVHELATTFGVDRPTLFRDLRLIEELRGKPTRLVPRRKKKTK